MQVRKGAGVTCSGACESASGLLLSERDQGAHKARICLTDLPVIREDYQGSVWMLNGVFCYCVLVHDWCADFICATTLPSHCMCRGLYEASVNYNKAFTEDISVYRYII